MITSAEAYGNAGTISLGPFFLARGFSVVEVEYRRRDHEGRVEKVKGEVWSWHCADLDILWIWHV